MMGLSPRVRGSPSIKNNAETLYKVYPRVCGGAPGAMTDAQIKAGLSPRVRGSLVSLSEARVQGGSIPACAGEP